MAEPKRKAVRAVANRTRHFAIPSKRIEAEDCRLDATSYTREVYEALRALEACPHGSKPLADFVAQVRHPTEDQAQAIVG